MATNDPVEETPEGIEPFVVYWQDYALAAALAAKDGCEINDLDPADYERSQDFVSLGAAARFARRADGHIERRVNFRRRDWDWDWDQEPVDESDGRGA